MSTSSDRASAATFGHGFQEAPCGSWKSPITSELITSGSGGLGRIVSDGQDLYWVESRSAEGGRMVIVRRTEDGQISDLTPAPYNVRTRVHEYGGASFAVSNGTLYFSNFVDQRVYRQLSGGEPEPITPAEKLRYADGIIDRQRGRMICVREDHTADGEGREAINTLVSIALDGGDSGNGGRVLVSGNDFYASPCLSPDGTCLAWLTWNHPNMPWDGTELWVAALQTDGTPGQSQCIAGGPAESIFQPMWSPANVLHFVSDRTGWWNLYRWQDGQSIALCPMQAEFGLPQWVFGLSTYTFASDDHIICSYLQHGMGHIADLTISTGELEEITTPYTTLWCPLALSPGRIVFGAGSATQPASIVQLDRKTGVLSASIQPCNDTALPLMQPNNDTACLRPVSSTARSCLRPVSRAERREVLRRSSNLSLDAGYLSTPQPIEFPTAHNLTAYALFYPPRNRDYVAPAGELPPLLVMSHGGPTGATNSLLNLEIQFWTSRGIAVLDVDYRGSTGYGRAYREQLAGQWGVADVEDCVNGARYMAARGIVDPQRLLITGGSAGGYTALCALTFYDTFRAGASHYGISDLEAIARDTHKFESRYNEKLVGPYPEQRNIYQRRSPIHYVDRLSRPVIFFQGLEDQVVPPNQAELMVQALRNKGLPVAYLAFEGEGHGFRRPENIKRALESELYFYARICGFELADAVEPVPIENL